MTFVVLNTHDLLRFFVDINMPGFRKDMVRVYQGIQQGDASVIAQAVQAAVAPSAGQQALQAGEGVPVHEGCRCSNRPPTTLPSSWDS